jgi:hypothetical protein
MTVRLVLNKLVTSYFLCSYNFQTVRTLSILIKELMVSLKILWNFKISKILISKHDDFGFALNFQMINRLIDQIVFFNLF